MGNKFIDLDIKKWYILLFQWQDYIKNLDPNKIKIDEKSNKILLFISFAMWRSKTSDT